MLNVSPHSTTSRRRDFLRVGTLAPLGLSLPALLRAQPAGARAKNCILVFLGGGMSHHDTFDPKPDAVEEIRGKYGVIPTSVAGLRISDQLPKTAQIMDLVSLVRSGSHNNDHHETASNWVLSGKFGRARGDHPSIGSVVAHKTGFEGVVPPYVAVPQNPSFTWELGTSVWLGGRCESFKCGDPNADGFKVRDLAPGGQFSAETVGRRRNLLETIDQLAKRVEGNDQIATFDEFSQKATDMVLSPTSRSAFDIEREDSAIREGYGKSQFGQSALMARRLIEHGVKFVTLNFGGWDHHAKIFEGLDKKLPEFDQGFSALIRDLNARGMLEDTLVATFGEFGRSPKINKDTGRDHWGYAGSMLFAGAGVQGGNVIGATDKNGAYVTDRPVRPADVAWTIYDSLGIDPAQELHMPDGRPTTILDEGEVISELFA
ncbi:MAG: hypothetical protein ACI8UO_003965 [Verrucomicrobiales bacterium]|jgi:hypothetical protein